MSRRRFLCLLSLTLLLFTGIAEAGERFITLASTTSTQNSGLLKALLPAFTADTGIEVRVVAVGTGQALRLARNGDADVLLVHDKASEKAFVAEGFGVDRKPVMYNDFVLIGPTSDPAKISETKTAAEALALIAKTNAVFISRGDDSGTHKAERRLWAAAKIDPTADSGGWYREAGSGMGQTLNIAAGMNGYTLSDRGTWLNFKNPGDLKILFQGDPALFNQYGVTLVNPARFPHIKAQEGRLFADWLTGPTGQALIAAYQIKGEQAFFPNAGE
ncbi:MAG: solute-binding protein [Rhodospirillaceae bacterium]|nr:solute-binding protein [Rhodospirillaceae bacterium]MBT5374260.1 solute-binding protein [Rhodospirillaceae bacterium]MBT5659526.1 solute-binding protein [Rhodospirillaceae bacterium]